MNEYQYYHASKYTFDFLFEVKIRGTANGKYCHDWGIVARSRWHPLLRDVLETVRWHVVHDLINVRPQACAFFY